jgi:ATP-dependent Clp protease ATP-binding subunit ClpA
MFERFTDRARRVVVLAQEEARILNHNYIGTEHILLGLLREGEGVAAKALESLGMSLEAVRQQVGEIIGKGQDAPSGHIPFTPRAKKVLELSLREALQLGHDYIGTEHILLGLLSEGEGVAAQVLVRLGADLKRVRRQVIQLLHGGQGEAAGAGPRRMTATRELWLTEMQSTLTSIADRLTAIERHLGMTVRPAATAVSGDPSTAAPAGGPTAAPGDPPAATAGDGAAAASDDPHAADSEDPPQAASDGT